MQTSQVPIWIPIVVGVIGLFGVIVGQLINARREDSRWEREKEREELRWKRDHEKEMRERDFEHERYWLDRRVEVYGQLLNASREWADVARRTNYPYLDMTAGKQTDKFAAADTKLDEAVTLIEIFGSDELIDLTKSLHDRRLNWFFDIVGQEFMSIANINRMSDDLGEQHKAILAQIRKEYKFKPPSPDPAGKK